MNKYNYGRFILELWHYHCPAIAEIAWNTDISSQIFFRRKQQHADKKYFRVTINFYKKDCLPVLARNKKHSSEKFVPRTFILEKKKFSSWYYSRFGSCFFSDRTKKLKLCLHHMSLLSIFKEEQTKQILSMRNKFSFLYVDI